MSGPELRTATIGRTLLLTIDRPPVNGLTAGIRTQLREEFEGMSAKDVGCVVLTGAGDRAFCAGQDLREDVVSGSGSPISEQVLLDLDLLCDAIRDAPCVVIAALNGSALGGGLEIALSCDLRIAVEGTLLGAVGLKMGLVAGTQRLARIAGEGVAKWMVLTAQSVGVETYPGTTLVHKVVTADALLPTALGLAARMERYSPRALELSKRCIHAASALPAKDALEMQRTYAADLLSSPEHLRAVSNYSASKA